MDDRDDSAEDSGSYELDLDGDTGDLDAAIREAVEAVESAAGAPAEAPPAGAAAATPAGATDGGGGEAAELRDRLARALADFDNYRKRVEREKEAARRYAHTEPLRDLLGVVDNLERARAAGGTVEDLKVGVDMIVRQLAELLRRHGVERLETVGERFDPNRHEAVSRLESADVQQPTVTAELQAGYRYHDRLLRPAMVAVAMPGAPQPATPQSAAPAAAASESAD